MGAAMNQSPNNKEKPFDLSEHVGELFQAMSQYRRGVSGWRLSFTEGGEPVELPRPVDIEQTLSGVLAKRRSIRRYSDTPMSLKTLSTLLWATQGVSQRHDEYSFKTAPSAGALYPVQTWVGILNVEGLKQGIMCYDDELHHLKPLRVGDLSSELVDACMNQTMVREAAVLFIWVADLTKCVWRYGQRAYRYIYLDAGHMAENTALACTALGLGSCNIGAYYDDMMNHICGLDGENRCVIYAASAGYPTHE